MVNNRSTNGQQPLQRWRPGCSADARQIARAAPSSMSTAPMPSARCKELGVTDVAAHFYGEAAGGWFAEVHDDLFVKLLGRHTTCFTRFAMDNLATFGGAGGD